jgi:hypothetical protein
MELRRRSAPRSAAKPRPGHRRTARLLRTTCPDPVVSLRPSGLHMSIEHVGNQRGHHPRPLLARHADHAVRGGSPARRRAERTVRVQMRVRRDSAATKKPRSRSESRLDETWYRIPESQQPSGGLRLSTVITVGAGQLRWFPAGSRVRLRVQARRDLERADAIGALALRQGSVRTRPRLRPKQPTPDYA